MSLIFVDGFDNYNWLPLKWDYYTYRCQSYITDGIGRNGTAGLRLYSGTKNTYDYIGKVLDEQPNEFIIGFAFKKVVSDFGYVRFSFRESIGPYSHSYLDLFNDSITFKDWQQNNEFGSIKCLKFNAWNYVELKTKVHQTEGSLEIRVNEHTVIHETNIDTMSDSSVNAFIDEVLIAFSPSVQVNADYTYIDDIYIATTSGTINNDFLGNCEVTTLYPTASGSYTQFEPTPAYSGTENYDIVNDEHTNDTTSHSEAFLEWHIYDDGCYNHVDGFSNNNNYVMTKLYPEDTPYNKMWFRFSKLNIPRHSIITSATLDMYRQSYYSSSNRFKYKLYLHETGTPSSQITSIGDFNSRNRTETYIEYDPNLTSLNGLDISALLQEIVSNDGWQEEDNIIQVLINQTYNNWGQTSNTNIEQYRAFDYRDDPVHADSPKIQVTWQEPGGDSGKFIISNEDGASDTYNYPSVSTTGRIYGIKQSNFTRMELYRANPNEMDVYSTLVVSGTKFDANMGKPNDIKYIEQFHIWEKNPVTSGTWSVSDINDLEAGITTISG